MSEPRPTSAPSRPDGRRTRWQGKTPAERRAATARATAAARAAASRRALDAHIDALVAAAPPLTGEQRDKLRLLLNGGS